MIRHTRVAFLRGLGVVFAIAFVSIAVQVEGLIGENGLAPTGAFLGAAREALGGSSPLRLPTVFWLDASDRALETACGVGIAASVALAVGIAPLPALAACWLLYLSFANVGQPFLLYQWDALLLETGFLALFWAPLALRLRPLGEPSRVVLWLFRWLVFRLMFFSGWVKLASSDRTWWSLTALEYHYETQPIPAWTSWYAHQLPAWAQKASCAATFGIELGLPFLVFAGRRARAVACAGFVALQALIAATGNYGFFNLLTVVLCIPLLDDAALAALARRLVPRRRAVADVPAGARRPRGIALVRDVAVAALLLALTAPLALAQLAGRWPRALGPLALVSEAADPFHLVGHYGLFAVMTLTRPEIVVEGSDDGATWKPYVFRWKPGPLDRAPSFVEPHMPRLDWQMWFDALYFERALHGGRIGRELVTPRLVEKLLAASPPVLALLAVDPFGGAPPAQIRWQLWDYRFTDREERARTGAWWKRTLLYESQPITRR
ncbi:MAG TPA: lipase maturation factor family protein [Candidatus Binatia bacterium]|nr:lipase maturation factor family protein [Candidatus Binatia bacterium]